MSHEEKTHDVLWRRMLYMLSPQWDIYSSLQYTFKGKDVLEVGFGTGFGVMQYATHANHVHAIELDKGAVDFAKKAFPLGHVDWRLSDITHMHGLYNIYDNVVMIEALEHVEEWQKALTNVKNMLRPGGKLYMSARNRNADLRRNDLHEREWTATELINNLHLVFSKVFLFDYSLQEEQNQNSRVTPLVAVATK